MLRCLATTKVYTAVPTGTVWGGLACGLQHGRPYGTSKSEYVMLPDQAFDVRLAS
jgi:hypothetical protein